LSRIDEALRRAETVGTDHNQTVRPSNTLENSQELFVSPWTVAEPTIKSVPERPEHPERPERPERSEARRVAPVPPVTLNAAWRDHLANGPHADPVLVEQFRRLAATLHHAQNASGIRIIMLTSASPDDGKTWTALNLALVLSESYRRRVLLIDADLRRPSLANLMDVTDSVGLSDALRAPSDRKLGILQIAPNLTLLPAGRPDPDPMGGLTSIRMRQILQEAAAQFDWVILDAPPMNPMADASLLAQMVEGAVFVVRAGKTQYTAVQRSIDALGRDRILGVVLNGVEEMPIEQYRYYSADKQTK
jgi:protein-tyrosine kinase